MKKIAGTDYSSTHAELTAKKGQIASEKAQAERVAEQEAETLLLADLKEKLAQFYGAWGVSRHDAELHTLALKYLVSRDELDDKLRSRYGGTDLSTPIPEIVQAKARQEEESREKEEKEHIEAERKRTQRSPPSAAKTKRVLPPKTPNVMSPKVPGESEDAEHDAGQSADGAAALERSLREFYAAWRVSRPDSEIGSLVKKFLGKEAELHQLLQKRYFGTDTTWSHTGIVEVRLRQDIDDAVDKLRAFYNVWGKPSETRDLVRLAEEYKGNRSGLNDALRPLHEGTDLESSYEEIQRKRQMQEASAKMQEHEEAKEKAERDFAAKEQIRRATQIEQESKQVRLFYFSCPN